MNPKRSEALLFPSYSLHSEGANDSSLCRFRLLVHFVKDKNHYATDMHIVSDEYKKGEKRAIELDTHNAVIEIRGRKRKASPN